MSATQNGRAPTALSGDRSAYRLMRILLPIMVAASGTAAWEAVVRYYEVPPYVLPAPSAIFATLFSDWDVLSQSLLTTLLTTLEGFVAAAIGGIALALIFNLSKLVEASLFPYAVILQVTPVIAIAPLLLIYTPNTQTALLIVAFLVAFFPILSNMVQGLKSVDHNLLNLFDLYGAGRWQQLVFLKIPASMPYFMTGLRIGGGLSLIAAVVAEFAAGSAGAGSGLAFRLLESGYRLDMPRLYAALILLTATGVAIFGVTSFISWLVLHRWHESAVRREN